MPDDPSGTTLGSASSDLPDTVLTSSPGPESQSVPQSSDILKRIVDALLAMDPQIDATRIAETVWLAALSMPDIEAQPPPGNILAGPPSRAATSTEASPPSGRPPSGHARQVTGSRRELYERTPSDVRPGLPGRAVRVPQGRALPQALDLARSMRPFKRPWATGRQRHLVLEATVDGYARSLELIPVFGPAPERWFELVIVVDHSDSMAVWRQTATEFTQVLRRTGAFRKLHAWDLHSSEGRLMLRGPLGQAIVPAQVKSSSGRRLVLVMSDCASEGWHSGQAWTLLREWAQAVPTVLVNPLPPRMWRYTGLDMPAVRVHAPPAAGAPNIALHYETPLILQAAAASENWTALPALALTPYSISRWARTLMRIDSRGCDAVLVPSRVLLDQLSQYAEDKGLDEEAMPAHGGEKPGDNAQAHEHQIVDSFLHRASRWAVRLAVLCTPYSQVQLPLLHLIREELVPEATVSDVAEVIVSGLFTVSSGQLRFREGIRGHLQHMLSAQDGWRLQEAISSYIAAHTATTDGFPAIVQDPHGDLALPPDIQPFAEASQATLQLLGVTSEPPVRTETTGNYVFVAYAEEDTEAAREIVQRLNDHGLEVWNWQDPRRRGRQFIQEIENAIQSADAFLALLSPSFLSSNWCRRERDVALRHEHDIQQQYPDRTFIHVLKIISTANSDTGFLGADDWADLTNPADRDAVLLDLANRLRPVIPPAVVSARAAGPGEPSQQEADPSTASAGSAGDAATGFAAVGSRLADPQYFVCEDELERVLRGLGSPRGTHFWLVIAPPQLGKTLFLQQIIADRALSESAGWVSSLVDLRDQAPGVLRDPAALLAVLFQLTSPVTTGQEALRGIARQIVRGDRPYLCLLDSAELLDKETGASLRWCLSQICRHVQDARRPGVRLGLVVASRRDDEWRGVTPPPRLSILPLTEFNITTVQQALEDLAGATNTRLSSAELKRYAEQVHRLTEGLPALLVECLRWIRAEEWREMDRLETQALFEQLTDSYIRQGLLARDSLFPGGQGEAAEPLPLEQVYRLLAPYRLFTLTHLRHHLESDPAFSTALRGQPEFMEDLWRAISGTALLLRPLNEPWQAIHPAIRRLLFRHYYTTDERRAEAHNEARKFVEVWAQQQVGKEQVIGLVECLWHEATTLRLLKPAEMERRLTDSARTLSLALESSSAYTLDELRDYAAERLRNDEELEDVVSIVDGLLGKLADIIVTPQ